MSHNIVIRRFEEGDEEKVNELLAIVFDGWQGRDYWRWKYRENPAGFYQNIWLAEEGGRVASYYALIPVMVKVNEEVILGAQSVDSATHPDYRRQGLSFSLVRMALTEAAREGIHIISSFPGSRSYGRNIKVGWYDLGSIPKRYRILKVGSALRLRAALVSLLKVRPRNLRDTARLFWKILRKQGTTSEASSRLSYVRYELLLLAAVLSNPRCLFRPGKVRQIPGLVIKEVDSFDARITSFWREISPYFPIAIDRNCDYLNWRYQRNPASKYVIFIAENRGQIEGYMVLKSEKEQGVIMDIISRENQVFACLLHRALQYFADEGKAIVECWMPGNAPYSKVLRKFGFGSYQWIAGWASQLEFLGGLINHFLIYLNSPYAQQIRQELQRPDSWFMAAGDSDWENMSQLIP